MNNNKENTNKDVNKEQGQGQGREQRHGHGYSRQDQPQDNLSLIPNSVLFNRKSYKKSKCPLSGPNAPVIDYKNIALLKTYVSEKGRIIPSRITGVSAKKQRALKLAIKRARSLALLPFAAKQ